MLLPLLQYPMILQYPKKGKKWFILADRRRFLMFLYERTTERLAKQKRISYYFMESGFLVGGRSSGL